MTSREGLGFARLFEFGATGVLAAIAVERSLTAFEVGPSRAIAALSLVLCILAHGFPRARRQFAERIVITDGVVRVSYYLREKLVEQRRMKLCDITIILRGSIDRNCPWIGLRSGDRTRPRSRTIWIARRLAPRERALFLEDFLEGLRRAGANPEIRRALTSNSVFGWRREFPRTSEFLSGGDGATSSRHLAAPTSACFPRFDSSLNAWSNAWRIETARRLERGKARERHLVVREQ